MRFNFALFQACFAPVVCLLLATRGDISHAQSDPTPQPQRPHIVVFLSDDHGVNDSPVYGRTDVRTPAMQRVASDGMTLDAAYVASPTCAPSRAALLTGMYPARNGAEANHTFPHDDLAFLPQRLREQGYDVASFGKVAHGHEDRVAMYDFDHLSMRDAHFMQDINAWLDERGDDPDPVCIFAGTYSPHVPWPELEPTGRFAYNPASVSLPPLSIDTPETREWRARYYADITRADEMMGNVYDIARERFGDNVIFIYTSDHGVQWPFAKWNLYEAGIRTPMLVVWPGHTTPGTRSDAMVSWIDILPTLLDVAGAEIDADDAMDGRSFVPVLQGETDTHRDRLFASHSGDGPFNCYPMRSLREGDFKYILNLHPEYAFTTHIERSAVATSLIPLWLSWTEEADHDQRAAAIVQRYHERPAEELYDLANDPDELHNLADDPEHAQRLAAMRQAVQTWMHETGDQGETHTRPHLLSDPDSYAPIPRDEVEYDRVEGR